MKNVTKKKNIRLITKLEVKSPNVIKGIQLEGLRVVGKPSHLAKKYYEEGIDEIIYIDIVASLFERKQIIETVKEAAESIFIPLVVGGGIRTLNDIETALSHGADKVALNTAAISDPSIIREASHKFGSQCIVSSIEAKKRSNEWIALTDNGRQVSEKNVLEWAQKVEELGAGEILLTSIDKDGVKKGFDIDLYRDVSDLVKIPVIACGGAGEPGHIKDLLDKANIDAICCSSIFHFNKFSISYVKDFLIKSGYNLRKEENDSYN